jgi:hypothetical protein
MPLKVKIFKSEITDLDNKAVSYCMKNASDPDCGVASTVDAVKDCIILFAAVVVKQTFVFVVLDIVVTDLPPIPIKCFANAIGPAELSTV